MLHLIRHAETTTTIGIRTDDPARLPLSVRGCEQADALAALFDDAPDLIIHSSFLRTAQTVAPLRARFPRVACEVWPVHEFTYLSTVRSVGTTPEERKPMVEAYWRLADPARVDGTGAESFQSLVARVDGVLARLAPLAERTVCLVSHGQFLQSLQWRSRHPGLPVDGAAMAAFRAAMGTGHFKHAQRQIVQMG